MRGIAFSKDKHSRAAREAVSRLGAATQERNPTSVPSNEPGFLPSRGCWVTLPLHPTYDYWAIYTRFNYGHESWQFTLTIILFVISTLLMLVGSFLDNFMMAGRARKQGSPWWEIGLSLVVMIVGGILLTPLGGLAAALLTLFLVEYYRLGKKQKEAWNATKEVALGWGWSTLIRAGIVLVMIALWLVSVLWL